MLVVGPQKGEFQSKGVNKQRERKNILDKWGKSIKDRWTKQIIQNYKELRITESYGQVNYSS